MQLDNSFVLGRAYSFQYPCHNYLHLPKTSEFRRIVVSKVRDTDRDPLDQTTSPLNPLLQRGRWLITGRDLDKQAERSFYAASMTEIHTLSRDDLEPLREAEYLVIEQTRVTFLSRRLADAITYRSELSSGTVCAVLCHGPRSLDQLWDEAESNRKFEKRTVQSKLESPRADSEVVEI